MNNIIENEKPIVTVFPMKSYKDTVKIIFDFAEKFKNDLREFENDSIFKFYNYVRNLKYIPDPKGKETVSRPKYTKEISWNGSRDCDDKTLLIMAFCNLAGIPSRAIVCGQGDKPHHVYPEIFISGKWLPADSTYKRCIFGKNLYTENYREVFEK